MVARRGDASRHGRNACNPATQELKLAETSKSMLMVGRLSQMGLRPLKVQEWAWSQTWI